VYAGQSLAEVFNALNVSPDFDYTKPESDTRILFVHRRLADGALYFLDNRNERDETVDASFRVTGKADGTLARRDRQIRAGIVQDRGRPHHGALHLEPWGTVFVVFRKVTYETSRTLPKLTRRRN
jgi:alpha-L-rhamnosidase